MLYKALFIDFFYKITTFQGMMPASIGTTSLPLPASLVSTWHRFGLFGPVYEIIGIGDKLANGDNLMRVRVVESGEELDYRFADILDDPKEC